MQQKKTISRISWTIPLLLFGFGALPSTAVAQSLRDIPVPMPSNLADFVRLGADGKPIPEAIQLGKALFWDMQLGSDGIQACASCHFHAGADNRPTNQLSPGVLAGDLTFQVHRRPNETFRTTDFPFHKLVNPENRGTGGIDPNDPAVVSSANDVASSQGVAFSEFVDIVLGGSVDRDRPVVDWAFSRSGVNTRRVEPRNTPTVINAVFNFTNFWDGRANHHFNGVNPFGPQDVNAFILVADAAGNVASEKILLDNSSLASQAVGPPLSDFEMSARGRTFPKIGKKMLSVTPLGKQLVHPDDSVLGPLARSRQTPGATGLNTTYADLIRATFLSRYWNSDRLIVFDLDSTHTHEGSSFDPRNFPVNQGGFVVLSPADHPAPPTTDEFTLMEANFSLFFGLAVQLYEATLVADDTPFDRFLAGDPAAMTDFQQRGFGVFQGGQTNCFGCHVGAELTAASVSQITDPDEPGAVEIMAMAAGVPAMYDIGFYNIGVRPQTEDIGRGGSDPFGQPLAFARQRQILNSGGTLPFAEFVPQQGCVPDLFADPPNICPPDNVQIERLANIGALKTPGLRNIELTGPYFHNGGTLTLRQVVDFYVRGGNFREANLDNLDPFIIDINGLKGPDRGPEDDRNALVDFMLALTDERVRQERAPFDHPQLFIPDKHTNFRSGPPKRVRGKAMDTELLEIPAVGVAGRPAEGLPPLKPFLMPDGMDSFTWHTQR